MVQTSKPESEAQSMIRRLARRCPFGHMWVRMCLLIHVSIQPLQFCAYLRWMCVWLCAFPHLRKENVLHSTREHSHYRRRRWSLEATALHVVWIDRVRFSPRRAVEHTLCHYQCPAVQTPLSPCFSMKKNIKKIEQVDKKNKYLRAADILWVNN